MTEEAASECEAFLRAPCAQVFTERRQLVSTRKLNPAEVAEVRTPLGLKPAMNGTSGEVVLEHERVAFASFPYEWPPEMLWEAGRLTLELAQAALADGYGLKDATPYNVLYRGSEAVFIDTPSFGLRDVGDPVWRPYGQFVRTFLLPLLANRYWGHRLTDIFLGRRDGLEPEDVYPLCGGLQRLKPQVLALVSLPVWLQGKARAQGQKLYQPRRVADPEKARFILDSLLKQLERALKALQPGRGKGSRWSNYMNTHSYEEPAFAAKEQFVREFLGEFQPKRVLDIGTNTGHFSLLAASLGASVVGIDLDPACVGDLWRQARERKADVLPLVVDIARPSPGLGWRNCECPSFLERATGQFQGLLMLAVIHHLLVTERIPLEEIIRLAAELSTSVLVIEFVSPQDEMFQQLTRGREHLHASLNEARFEEACRTHFEIVRSMALSGTHRRLYGLRVKRGAS